MLIKLKLGIASATRAVAVLQKIMPAEDDFAKSLNNARFFVVVVP